MTPAEAVSRTYMNRAEIERSEVCGCYRCAAIFPPSEITLWSDSMDPQDEEPGALRDNNHRFPGYTAICPFCEDASVIGSASGAPVTPELLALVQAYWSRK